MIRASRPKPRRTPLPRPPTARHSSGSLFHLILAGMALAPATSFAQSPVASSYATRDGHAPSLVLACVSVDGSFTAQPCGVSGYPVHVTIDGGVSLGGVGTPTTAAGTASTQLVGVQGGGSGALPVAVTDGAVPLVVTQAQLAAIALGAPSDTAATSTGSVVAQLRRIANLLAAAPNGPLNADGGEQVHVTNLPVTQPVSATTLPLPAGAATAAAQPALSGDGGALSHVVNFPASQAVSAATLPLPAGAATAALQPALNATDNGAQVHVQNFPGTQAVTVASLPLPAGAAMAAAQPALNGDGGALAHVSNFPSTQAVSATALPLPAGAATAALQSAVNTDGGSQVHVQNFPASQAVTNAGAFAVQDSAVIAGVTSVAANTAARSGAWTDASFTASTTAAVPTGLAAVALRYGLHVWNVGTVTACMNYTGAATVSGNGCAAGSVPIPAGSAYLEDQPGNVSPEAISVICAGVSCPLTIKVR